MTEAVSELTRFGFEDAGLVRLEAFVMLENVASDHLLKRSVGVEGRCVAAIHVHQGSNARHAPFFAGFGRI